ncbi:hypothetical protein BDN70DRAFT_11436 [Pholiota conissans]|uniref:Uncharacterized protein n=1 Tax=Pholiota conissans TaxID=109636 RepID=A0A9P5ZHB2_9AGAR|nr:hypothetical protein BDN70DRAFT_11436 [Pholiota conissans]
MGKVLSSAIHNFKNSQGKPDTALNRLYAIIMTESLYTIWLLRCEWKMDLEEDTHKLHTKPEISARWQRCTNRRIRLDQTITTKKMKQSQRN